MIGEESRSPVSSRFLWLVLAMAILYLLLRVCGVRVMGPDGAQENVSSSSVEAAAERRPVKIRNFGSDSFPEVTSDSTEKEDPDEEILR